MENNNGKQEYKHSDGGWGCNNRVFLTKLALTRGGHIGMRILEWGYYIYSLNGSLDNVML